ncbi:MAG: PilT/PilU family type 4a pilus ATPase [Gaiellales bacterium]
MLRLMLRAVVDHSGSDLHLRFGERPFMRHQGQLEAIPGLETRMDDDWLAGLMNVLTDHRPDLTASLKEFGEADLAYEIEGFARYRVNIFKERGRLALTLRTIPYEVPKIDEIGVPVVVKDMAMQHHGLVLVTGATGTGKSTTLAAMINHRNHSSAGHILTIEDPIEIVHPNHLSLVSQREVGMDTPDFGQALRRALRQDPDVILIGEIRDEETMRTALAAAETGHLVLATLHTINAQETISRVLDLFPSEAETQARAMLAGVLKGIVSQRLARTMDGKRVPVVEVLVNTPRIANAITNPEETHKIGDIIAEGEYYGMQTFDQGLIRLIMTGRINEDEAVYLTTSPQDFKLKLDAARGNRQVEVERRNNERVAREQVQQQQMAQQQQQMMQPQQQQMQQMQPGMQQMQPGMQQMQQPGMAPQMMQPGMAPQQMQQPAMAPQQMQIPPGMQVVYNADGSIRGYAPAPQQQPPYAA